MAESTLWLEIAALGALLVLSGFFSMSETAFIRSNSVRVKGAADDGDRRAKRLVGMLRRPEQILSAVLVGNNIANIGAASLATVIAVQVWGPSGAILAAFGLTVIVLIFAEITPKTLAVHNSEGIAMRISGPLRIADLVLRPIAWFATRIANGILRMFGFKPHEGERFFVTQEEIEMMVKVGAQEGEVEAFEQRVIEEVFDFTETAVKRVVTPWSRVRFLHKDATLKEALDMVGATGHSRLPIVDGDYEHVMGFVHAKDLLKHSDEDLDELPVTTELRAVLFTGANTRADKVLARMQRERKLMAVVQDADGRNLGIATVEDLLEELVGEIHDEFDETRHAAERRELAEAAQAEAAQAEAAQASRPPGNT